MANFGNAIAVDPHSKLKVRFTDNSAKTDGKEPDFYPEDQSDKPLDLDPAGVPYTQLEVLGYSEYGDGAETDAEWEEALPYMDGLDAHILNEDMAGVSNDDR